MRVTWSQYFMQMADIASQRSSCTRLNVGCVLVDAEQQVISTGYNGAPRGLPHCDEVGCLMVDGHCKRSNHAEANALIQAARRGTSTVGSTAYVSHYPCIDCFRSLLSAGVKRIVFGQAYGPTDPHITDWASQKDVRIYQADK